MGRLFSLRSFFPSFADEFDSSEPLLQSACGNPIMQGTSWEWKTRASLVCGAQGVFGMAISFSQTALLTCPQCNTPFDADIWLIVDAGERPDLVARCHDGSIHVVACPNNHSGMLPAPLLYHDRAKQQLFLAYPQNMSEEQVQEVGKQLVHQLRNQLLALPNSGYLDAPRALPIELLPAAMDDKQDEVMAEMQAQFEKLRNDPAIAAAARVLQEHRALGETIQEWINLDAWNTSKEFLATHPELLTNDADLVLAAMLDLARAQDDADAQEDLQVHREIARDARENGIDAAYEKYVARGANDERASDARAQLQARLAELNIHSQQELERALPDHPELQELLARAMRQENPILQAIEKLMETRSPQEVIQLARIYPLLLDDDGMNAIREIISNARERGDEGMANHLQERFAILEQIKASGARPDDLAQIAAIEQSLDDETRAAIEELRALGISNEQELQAALEKRPDLRAKLERAAQASAVSPGDVPDDVRSILQEISRLTRLPDMPRKIELCRAALERITREQNQNLWAGLNGELANALNQNPQGSRAENLEEAIRHYELALEVYTRVAFPEQWSGTQNNLANAYKNRIRGERADNLEEAIRHFELALEVYTRAAFPTDWAMTQNNLANAYRNRIRGERAENLEEAIRHFELALEVYTRAAFPEQWATTQNNLALAYSDRIRGERADNLEEAIRHFELALEV
ncbi:MAG: tetratricopeptide repeat protein, partial [Chloroflexota bacterium]